MNDYLQSRTCGGCGHQESRTLALQQAAFEETRQWLEGCAKCGSTRFSSESFPLVDMNRELFEMWIHDKNLTVMSQDEHIIIGTGENLALLEEFLRRRDAVPGKRDVLLSAICVVLYDNTPQAGEPDDFYRPEFLSAAVEVLKRNLAVFDELNENYISDYIKEVAYPAIGRQLPTMG